MWTPKAADDQVLIKHLLRRAGFGHSRQELGYYQSLGYERAVRALLEPERTDNSQLDALIQNQNFDYTRLDDLKRWWIYRMAFTSRPLEEKIALFWHGHFATSNQKVESAYAMYMQNLVFRRLGLGNFGDLLMAVTKDPAMIRWLDNQQNVKGKPNENYAREVMELFSLGIGNYSERDIKESARAFTGWQTHPDGFFFNANLHDYGPKTFLGQTGNFNGDDIIGIIINQQPAVGKFLATKLCKFFVADNPTASIVADVAAVYRPGGSIKDMLSALFTHDDFKKRAFYARIKSPVEFAIGSLKNLDVGQLDNDIATQIGRMGQSLFEPPNVKGWDGGPDWIATDTMMERFNFIARLTQQKFDAIEGYVKPSQLIKEENLSDAQSMIAYFLRLLVDGNVPDNVTADLLQYMSTDSSGAPLNVVNNDRLLDSKLRGLVHLIMTLPTYQFC